MSSGYMTIITRNYTLNNMKNIIHKHNNCNGISHFTMITLPKHFVELMRSGNCCSDFNEFVGESSWKPEKSIIIA
jgi:hypothetical protein